MRSATKPAWKRTWLHLGCRNKFFQLLVCPYAPATARLSGLAGQWKILIRRSNSLGHEGLAQLAQNPNLHRAELLRAMRLADRKFQFGNLRSWPVVSWVTGRARTPCAPPREAECPPYLTAQCVWRGVEKTQRPTNLCNVRPQR